MSMQSLNEFRGKVNGNAQLEEAVRACGLDLDAMAALGRSQGFEFTRDEIVATFSAPSVELSDLELEMVSGGAAVDCGTSTSTHG